jgi:hypothetical protein
MDAALAQHVTYTSASGKSKVALVIGTPEFTGGRIPEGQVTL